MLLTGWSVLGVWILWCGVLLADIYRKFDDIQAPIGFCVGYQLVIVEVESHRLKVVDMGVLGDLLTLIRS